MKFYFTSDVWDMLTEIDVIDPDGWDRSKFEIDWFQTPITFEQFLEKCQVSTCQHSMLSRTDMMFNVRKNLFSKIHNFS